MLETYIKNNLDLYYSNFAYFLTKENKNIALFNCLAKNISSPYKLIVFYSKDNFTSVVKNKTDNENIIYEELENYEIENLYRENYTINENNLKKIKEIFKKYDVKSIILDFIEDEMKNTMVKNIFKEYFSDKNFILPYFEISTYPIKDNFCLESEVYSNINNINYDLIFRNNEDIIKAIENNKDFDKVKKCINFKTNFYDILIYFCSKSFSSTVATLKYFSKYMKKPFFLTVTKEYIEWNKKNDEIFDILSKYISNEDINKLLLNFVKDICYYTKLSNSNKNKNRLIYFYNKYKDIITETTKNRLLYFTLWKDGFNKNLVDLFIGEFDLNLGDLIIMCTKTYYCDEGNYNRLRYFLENYSDKVSEIQLDEALIYAKQNNLSSDILNLLIEYGANSNLLNVKFFSEAYNNFTREYPLFRSCAEWFERDRVIIKYLLKQLGNPQKKVPPVIHVTGSNGKGSTCAFLQSILEKNGYTVHKFVSPALMFEGENYIVSGKEISDEQFYEYLMEVKKAYDEIQNNEDYLKDLKEADESDSSFHINDPKHNGVLSWCFLVPMAILAFSKNKADFTIIEVITGGLYDLTNVFTEKETVATVLTYIQYGIGSNDGMMGILNKNGEYEYSNRANAYHKTMLGKKDVPIIVANQTEDVLEEIRKVARDDVKTTTFEYGRDWFIKDETKNSFIIKCFNEEYKFKKSKTLFEKFQLFNTATAIVTLLKLKNENKLKLNTDLTQKGIDNTEIIGRPQKILKGNYVDYFNNKNTEIITGVVKLNKNGVDSIINIINDDNTYFNYFVYTSANNHIGNKVGEYLFDFIKKISNSKIIIYKKEDYIYKIIKNNLSKNNINYIEKSNLSSSLVYIKNEIKQNNNNKKNRIFILCDSMVNFDKNQYFLNKERDYLFKFKWSSNNINKIKELIYEEDYEKILNFSLNRKTEEEIIFFLKNFIDRNKFDSLFYQNFFSKVFNKYNKLSQFLVKNYDIDIGDILFELIEVNEEEKINNLLGKYGSYISKIQLDEALLKVKYLDNNISIKLIELGANKNLLTYNSYSYGYSKFIQKYGEFIGGVGYYGNTYLNRVVVKLVLSELGNPQNKIKNIIHVTGSNGKGSTCTFLQSILEKNGYSVNKHISPYLIKNNEEIVINGKEIDDDYLYDIYERSINAYNKIKNSDIFIEETSKALELDKKYGKYGVNQIDFAQLRTIAMILAFSENPSDFNIIEVVNGGLFDATNIFTEKETIATVLTPMVMGDNHGFSLGNNIAEKADQKARLCKPGVPIISSIQEPEAIDSIKKVAEEFGCPLYIEDRDYNIKINKNNFVFEGFGKKLSLSKPKNLLWDFQVENASVAVATLLSTNVRLDKIKTSNAIENTCLISSARILENGNLYNYAKKHANVEILLGLGKSYICLEKNFNEVKKNYKGYKIFSILSLEGELVDEEIEVYSKHSNFCYVIKTKNSFSIEKTESLFGKYNNSNYKIFNSFSTAFNNVLKDIKSGEKYIIDILITTSETLKIPLIINNTVRTNKKIKIPTMKGSCFLLRPLNIKKDKISYIKNINNPKIFNNLNESYPFTENDWEKLITREKNIEFGIDNSRIFVIEIDGEVVGSIEAFYYGEKWVKNRNILFKLWLAEKYWNQGIMTEAERYIEDYIFKDLKLNKITCDIFAYNKASIRVAEKNGYYLDYKREKYYFKNNEWQDILYYSKDNPYLNK